MKFIRSRVGTVIARFRRDREASVAIEFGMLALPFAVVMFAVLESCVSFAAQQVLSNVTDDIARKIRTGQPGYRAADITKAKLETEICNELSIIVTACPGGTAAKPNLLIDLRTFDTFQEAADLRIRIVNKDIDTTGFDVKAGISDQRQILRVFYKWPIMTDLLRYQMSNLDGFKTLQFATTTWKNEPFDG